ncbi:MAG: fibronectin type III domain-containing protein [Treponema sp.]|nr:fibronectin type III domain-containing protein [Treponema sp.]
MAFRKNIIGRFCLLILLTALSVFFAACSNILWGINREAPKNLRVSSITADSAVLSWNPVNKASKYEIMWRTDNDGNYWKSDIINAEAGTNSFTIDNLLYEREYKVQIAAMFEKGNNQYVMSDYATISFKTLKDIPPSGELARPGNVKASFNQDKTAISISWDGVEAAVYYDVNLKSDELYFHAPRLNVLNTVAAPKTEYIYSGFLPESRIVIKVAARNSDFSDSCRWSYEVEVK